MSVGTRLSSRLLRARAAQRGFTLVELMVVVILIAVLSAIGAPAMLEAQRSRRAYEDAGSIMTIFKNARARAIGAVSVVAMERTSVQGDSDARQQDVATGIANEWVARLQKDELNWKVTAPTDTTVARAATSYLNNSYVPGTCGPVGADASGSYVPTFYAPNIGLTITPTTVEGRGYAYDIFGHDSTDYANAVYCVALSECFQDGPTSNNLIQATVLVYWGRKIASNPASGWCPSSTANFTSTTFDPQVYRSVTSTVLLQAGGGQK